MLFMSGFLGLTNKYSTLPTSTNPNIRHFPNTKHVDGTNFAIPDFLLNTKLGAGFEPTWRFPSPDLQSGAFVHSANRAVKRGGGKSPPLPHQ